MRTVKASEVVKGMRVRASSERRGVVLTLEGKVILATHSANSAVTFEDGTLMSYAPDHPVTVLAEPEPEWVEGAWYWVEFTSGGRRPMFRDNGLWSAFPGGSGMRYEDADLTVLGRVLIVDWPGDLTAQSLLVRGATKSPCDSGLPDDVAEVVDSLADAIRTQGGAP